MTLTQLRQEIVNIMNKSDLPIDGIYFVTKDILNEVSDLYREWINNVAAAQESKEEMQKEQAAPSADIIEKEEN